MCILLLLCGGSPPAAAQEVVVQADPAYAWVLGPVLRGPSPWPWFDVTEAADADILAPLMMTPPTSIAGPGTIAATAPPNRIDAAGQITSEGTSNTGVVWTGTGTNFTQADVGQGSP